MSRLQAAMLCNAATVEQSGLVSMLGAFVDTLQGPLPLRSQLWFAGRLLWDDEDLDRRHSIVVKIEGVGLDLPGPVVELTGEMTTPRPEIVPSPELPIGAVIVVPLVVELPKYGLYVASLHIGGQQLWQTGLLARPLTG